MTEPSLRDHLTSIVGPALVDRVIDLLEEEAATRCTDPDCARRRRHSRLDWHQWKHAVGAPRSRGLFGWRCFNCGRYGWRHIHRDAAGAQRDGGRP